MDAAQEMIRAVFDDGEAEINGRTYVFVRMTHKKRRRVFAFYTSVAKQVQGGDFSFLDDPRFEAVESVINNAVTLDGSLLSKLGDAHWEDYAGDYLPFTATALAVISYPFLAASPTG